MSEGPPKPQAFSLLNVWGAFLDKCDTGTLASRNSCLGVLLKLRGICRLESKLNWCRRHSE